jgi:protein-S-isoprenylcysteine O-methyltransferase Ste14
VVGAAGLGGLLFLGAGTTDWAAAWVWVALFTVISIAAALLLPDAILRERMRGPVRAGQTPADLVFVAVFGVVLLGWFVLIGVDAVRFGWSSVPAWLQVVGLVLFLAGNGVGGWALHANEFASASVRVDDEHVVASDGPYRVVRHPMYVGVLLFVPGTALLLGSYVGAAAVVAIAAAVGVRVVIEERTLRGGLAGYADYASRVRWRLVPGVW